MKKLILIVLLGAALRIIFASVFAKVHEDYYWEYGELAKNMIHGRGYSLFYYNGNNLEHKFNPDVKPYVSAYMSPGYVYYLTPFIYIDNVTLRNVLLLLTHLVISLAVICITYFAAKNIFSEDVALIAALLASILPDCLAAVATYTPTVHYQLFTISILYLLSKKHTTSREIFITGGLISIAIFFRSEFVLFLILLLVLFFFEKKYRYSLVIIAAVLILNVPWAVRNFHAFNRTIPFSTSFGLNLYRGNSTEEIGSWGNETITKELSENRGYYFELKMNEIYQNYSLKYLKENPLDAVKKGWIKFFYFWFYNPDDSRSGSIIYYVPSVILTLLFITGMIKSFSWNDKKYFYLFFIYSSLITIIFFPLPRYQAMMRPAMLPFCAAGLKNLLDLLPKPFSRLIPGRK